MANLCKQLLIKTNFKHKWQCVLGMYFNFLIHICKFMVGYSTTLHYCLSAGNVKSDYFQWQKIDDLGSAASNLLLLVFFDVLAFVFTCIVGLFICKINLIQVNNTSNESGRQVLFLSGLALCCQRVWIGLCCPSNVPTGPPVLHGGE